MKPLFFHALVLLFIFSCKNESASKRERVARVGNNYLYLDELQMAVPTGLSQEDSLFRSGRFIRSWIKEQLVFDIAMRTLADEEKDKKTALDNYYRSLIRHTYEEKMAIQNSDTVVTDVEIENYYNENQQNFELKRNIIRLLYVKLPLHTLGIEKAKGWVYNFNGENLDSLRDFADEYASNSVLDTSSWFYFDDIAKEIPIDETYSYGHFVRNNSYIELKDAYNVYLINIVDRKIKDDIAPLALVKNRIKKILHYQRQVEFLQNLENNIFKDAVKNQKFEIYKK